MKESEAMNDIKLFAFSLQKYRSVTAEEIPHLDEESKALMWPWVFGDKCPLEALTKVIDRGQVEASTYYNFMVVANQFMPEIVIASGFYSKDNEQLPKQPNVGLLAMGWDEE